MDIGLREPQRGSLIPPIEGQSGVGHQLVGSEPRRLLPCKDCGDNIRGEKSRIKLEGPQTMNMMMHAIYRLDTLLGPAARWLINELQAGE